MIDLPARPTATGVTLTATGAVSIYAAIGADDDFATAAELVFGYLRAAQQHYPDAPRYLFVTIAGHRGERAGYDADFFEFQQEFLLGALGPFITAIDQPMTGSLRNPQPQRNDLPDKLQLQAETPP